MLSRPSILRATRSSRPRPRRLPFPSSAWATTSTPPTSPSPSPPPPQSEASPTRDADEPTCLLPSASAVTEVQYCNKGKDYPVKVMGVEKILPDSVACGVLATFKIFAKTGVAKEKEVRAANEKHEHELTSRLEAQQGEIEELKRRQHEELESLKKTQQEQSQAFEKKQQEMDTLIGYLLRKQNEPSNK